MMSNIEIVKAMCDLKDPELIKKINEHPKYNAVGDVDSWWHAVYESNQDRIYPKPNREREPYTVEGMISREGFIYCNDWTKTEEEAYLLFLELVNYRDSEKIGRLYEIRHFLTNKVEIVRRESMTQFLGNPLTKISRLSPLEIARYVRLGKLKLKENGE